MNTLSTWKAGPIAPRFLVIVTLIATVIGVSTASGQHAADTVSGPGGEAGVRDQDRVIAGADAGAGQLTLPRIQDLIDETSLPHAAEADAVGQVDLDVVYLSNAGQTVLLDHFDDQHLGFDWLVVGGNPGPETGTILEMRPGDGIIAPVFISSPQNTFALAHLRLTDFPPGTAAAMLLTGDQPGDQLLLVVLRSFAILLDEHGLLGVAALNPGATTATPAIFMTNGFLIATVNGGLVYAGENTLGVTTSIGIFVVD